MSLATRCTACGTIFRIVEDQLRVSDGWVRCGRCAEIFDARELLFDIERDVPPPWPVQFTPETMPDQPLPSPPAPLPPPPAPLPPPAPATRFDAPAPWMPPPDPEPHLDALPTGWPSTDISRQEPRWIDDTAAAADALASPPAVAGGLTSEPPEVPTAPPMTMPEFMRRAQVDARWNRPAVRLGLALLSLLLVAALALQILLHFRDAMAALHPPLREHLQALCNMAGCEIQPWKRIDALSIDATSLNPIGTGGYKLNLSLRNKTGVDVAAPWVELSLTDTHGAPMARRVLGPEAMSPALSHVDADSEHALSLVFSTGGQRISGYSVNIFYP